MAFTEHQCKINSRSCWSLEVKLDCSKYHEPTVEAWLDVHYEPICLLSPSSLEVNSDGHQAKNTSIDHLHVRIYSHPVADEDHMCQTCRESPETKTVTYIWCSWGQDCNAATKYHRVMSPSRRYITITKPRFAALGNYAGPLSCIFCCNGYFDTWCPVLRKLYTLKWVWSLL